MDDDTTANGPDEDRPPGSDEELKAEVAALRAELATRPAGGRSSKGWWRPLVCGLLLALVVVLSPLSVLAVWTHAEIADTDRYVDTVAPLASNPDVQDAVANRISTTLLTYIDVPKLTSETVEALSARGLSDRAAAALTALSVPLTNAVTDFVHTKVLELVQSDAFAQAWEEANRQAHEQMVAVLTGETNGAVSVSGNEVSVKLATFIDTVKQALVDQGFQLASRIPTVDATFVVFSSDNLGKAQQGFHLLDTAAIVLPLLTLVLIVVAVFVARVRRTAIIAAGLCVAGGMLLLGLALNGFRPFYLDSLPADVSRPAAGAIYDQLISFLRMNIRGVLLLGIAVAFIAWAGGPTRSAKSLRRGTSSAVHFVRERPMGRLDLGGFGRTMWEIRTMLRIAIIALGALYLLSQRPVTGVQVAWTLIVMLVVWLIVELLATPPHEEAAEQPGSIERP